MLDQKRLLIQLREGKTRSRFGSETNERKLFQTFIFQAVRLLREASQGFMIQKPKEKDPTCKQKSKFFGDKQVVQLT
ncbi:hypothetical protein OXYTRIMIC_636 [Oxytricha trifallax]|uniref:Uncharacterized protein n=1 Tax=Oxytricha trifallax TaxID=1172189 RepID=A0A073HZR8_9SPIT|nr:hypothetical protein OXYTRIMIC_636 [Oxytricha trifallax]